MNVELFLQTAAIWTYAYFRFSLGQTSSVGPVMMPAWNVAVRTSAVSSAGCCSLDEWEIWFSGKNPYRHMKRSWNLFSHFFYKLGFGVTIFVISNSDAFGGKFSFANIYLCCKYGSECSSFKMKSWQIGFLVFEFVLCCKYILVLNGLHCLLQPGNILSLSQIITLSSKYFLLHHFPFS